MTEIPMSDITICIITDNNYIKLQKTINLLRRYVPSCVINILDSTPVPDPKFFPDTINQYIIAQPFASEALYKGILIESVKTNYMLFVTDEYVTTARHGFKRYASPTTKMTRYRLIDGKERLKECTIFDTVKFPNPNGDIIKNSMINIISDTIPETFEYSRPLNIREEDSVRNKAFIKEQQKREYIEPTNLDKNKLVGLWTDVKTNFIYKINADGSAAFCNVPRINVKPHRWRKTAEGDIEIINAEHNKFKVNFQNDNEIVIMMLDKKEFDFHNVGKNIKERILIKHKKS